MNFLILIALVFCKRCTLPVDVPEGLRTPSFYASYYTALWASFNCGYPGGLFWKRVSRNQLQIANSKAVASLGRLVVRPEYERVLRGFLA